MQLQFVIHPEMVTGEVIRHFLTKKGCSARDLANHLMLHEGNISYMLSRGQQMKKHREEVLNFVGLTESSLKLEEMRLMSILAKAGVVLVDGWKHADPLLVTVPYEAVQKLYSKENING